MLWKSGNTKTIEHLGIYKENIIKLYDQNFQKIYEIFKRTNLRIFQVKDRDGKSLTC